MEDCESGRPGRRALRRFALIAGVLVTVGALLSSAAPRILERAVPVWARTHGVEGVSFEVRTLGWRRAVFANLRVAGATLPLARRIVLDYAPWRLLSGRIDGLALEEIAISGRLDQSGLSLGALDAIRTFGPSGGAGDDGEQAGRELAPARLRLDSARLDLVTPIGPLSAVVDATLDHGELNASAQFQVADAQLEARVELASSPSAGDPVRSRASPLRQPIAVRIDAAARDLSLAPLRPGAAALRLEGELDLRGDGLALVLRDCALVALPGLRKGVVDGLTDPFELCLTSAPDGSPLLRIARDGRASARFGVDHREIAATVAPAGDLDLRLEGTLPRLVVALDSGPGGGEPRARFSSTGGALSVFLSAFSQPLAHDVALHGEAIATPEQIEWSAEIVPPGGIFSVSLSGGHRWDVAEGAGRAQIPRIVFEPDGLSPADLFAPLDRWIDSASGATAANASLHWSPAGIDGTAALQLDQLSLSSGGLSVEGLDGWIRVPLPFASRGAPDTIRFSRARAGALELGGGALTLALTPKGGLDVEKLSARILGGRVHGEGTIRSFAEEQSWVFSAEGISVRELLDLLDVDGLHGDGRLTGRIPVVVGDGHTWIRGGELRSVGNGWIRYRPATPSRFLAGSVNGNGGGVDLAMRVLENFQYERAVARIDGDIREDVSILLQLRGANPDVGGGREVEFNLNLDVPVAQILRGVAAATTLSEKVERRIRERAGELRE